MIEDNNLYEYTDGQIIAKIPIKVQGKNILVFDPENDYKIFAELKITNQGNITNSAGATFSLTEEGVAESFATISPRGVTRSLCRIACRATHRTLGLPRWVDRICCFWYPPEAM